MLLKTCTCGQPAAPYRALCTRCRMRARSIAARVNPCGCGCGTPVASKFAHGHHTRLFTAEEQARRGRQNDGDKQRDRGMKDTYRKVAGRHEHRVVAERKVGRKLTRSDIVHHKNEIKRDNDPDNLEVTTRSKHIKEHWPKLQAARFAKLGY